MSLRLFLTAAICSTSIFFNVHAASVTAGSAPDPCLSPVVSYCHENCDVCAEPCLIETPSIGNGFAFSTDAACTEAKDLSGASCADSCSKCLTYMHCFDELDTESVQRRAVAAAASSSSTTTTTTDEPHVHKKGKKKNSSHSHGSKKGKKSSSSSKKGKKSATSATVCGDQCTGTVSCGNDDLKCDCCDAASSASSHSHSKKGKKSGVSSSRVQMRGRSGAPKSIGPVGESLFLVVVFSIFAALLYSQIQKSNKAFEHGVSGEQSTLLDSIPEIPERN